MIKSMLRNILSNNRQFYNKSKWNKLTIFFMTSPYIIKGNFSVSCHSIYHAMFVCCYTIRGLSSKNSSNDMCTVIMIKR